MDKVLFDYIAVASHVVSKSLHAKVRYLPLEKTILTVVHATCKLSHYFQAHIKHNLNHAWLFGPHTLGKLILYIICLSVKQNLGHVWFLEPRALGKLILSIIYLSIK